MIFSLRVNAEPDASVKDCLEITRQPMQNPRVRDVKAHVGEPGIMAVCHWESYSRGVSVFRSGTELLGSLTSVVQHNTFHRVDEFPAFLNPRSSVSISTLAAENINRIKHHHVWSLGLLQALMTPDFIE